MTTPVFIVDAFTDEKFGGNPAAVCLSNKKLSDKQYQKIAVESPKLSTRCHSNLEISRMILDLTCAGLLRRPRFLCVVTPLWPPLMCFSTMLKMCTKRFSSRLFLVRSPWRKRPLASTRSISPFST
ncbi:hypothetical protein L596_002013 [Steinernema carpocapsae]|uniref:Phenazine biosynthesis-like domain-containing protein n=1 Tax=Steinernema carpocapsae TaxID=34508 RepID=A0A4U8UNA5_STECR|nr:hypothetical protein L596_002013 [Steinernema carpocapsae]